MDSIPSSEKDAFDAISRGDTNGDGREDLIATLVETRKGRKARSVAAFHAVEGGYDTSPVWVVRSSDDSIFSALALERKISLVVCLDCDDVPVFRWGGEAYETGIRLPKEQACINAGTTIYTAPDLQSPEVYKQANEFGFVEVLELSTKTTRNTRWHKVRLLRSASDSSGFELVRPEIRGFMDSTGFFNDIGC